MSDPSAGPSTSSRIDKGVSYSRKGKEKSQDQVHVQAPKAIGPKRRKAGGEGKKGKVFLEDRAGLLDLISNVTSSSDAIAKTKLDRDRQRQSANPTEPPVGGKKRSAANMTKVGGGKQKEHEKAIRSAKVAITSEAREKKRLKREKAGGAEAPGKRSSSGEAAIKKKVGFA